MFNAYVRFSPALLADVEVRSASEVPVVQFF